MRASDEQYDYSMAFATVGQQEDLALGKGTAGFSNSGSKIVSSSHLVVSFSELKL